jgi:hypothetical protein
MFVVIWSAYAQPPDTLWTRTFGGANAEEGHSVQQTTDGGFIIAGQTGPSGGSSDVYLVKTDATGNQLWTRTFGLAYTYDMGYAVRQTVDGGYIIAGKTSDPLAPILVHDVYLIKTNNSGIQEWTRSIGGNDDECGYSLQQTSDGGYVIAGYTKSYGAGQADVYLIKTDASGITLWTQTYGGSSNDYGYCVQQTSDGGYIIAGQTYSYGLGESDMWLIKTDASGNQLWAQHYGGLEPEIGRSVQQTTDGGYILAGSTKSYGGGAYDVFLVKTNDLGAQEWTQAFGGSNYDMGYGVQQTQDGGYIVAGDSASYGTGICDAYVIKTNASGSLLWSQTFGGGDSEYGRSVQQTSDDGYIIAGYTNSYGSGDFDVYLIRLAPEITDLSVTLTPHNPPIQIPAGGGSFQYDIVIENITAEAILADAWIEVIPPGGPVIPLLVRLDLTFPANSTISRPDLAQNVPPGAPPGIYTYTCSVGEAMGAVIDSDQFTFEKLATGEGLSTSDDWIISGWEENVIQPATPAQFSLSQPYPNPFNPSTVISYHLSVDRHVNLAVYDISGRCVVTLIDGWREVGFHEVRFDASELASGIYIARIEASGYSVQQKIIYLK